MLLRLLWCLAHGGHDFRVVDTDPRGPVVRLARVCRRCGETGAVLQQQSSDA